MTATPAPTMRFARSPKRSPTCIEADDASSGGCEVMAAQLPSAAEARFVDAISRRVVELLETTLAGARRAPRPRGLAHARCLEGGAGTRPRPALDALVAVADGAVSDIQ
jgi:hypothetical protein